MIETFKNCFAKRSYFLYNEDELATPSGLINANIIRKHGEM